MSGYTPLFSSLTTGTLCGKWPDIGLWPIILSLSDKSGHVDVTPMYLSGVTGLPVVDVVACMKRFCEPDPYSRTNSENGARLILIDQHREWGWIIVNHLKYREKARKQAQQTSSTQDGRDAERKRNERQRPAMSGDVQLCPAPSGPQTQTHTQTQTQTQIHPSKPLSGPVGDFESIPSPTAPTAPRETETAIRERILTIKATYPKATRESWLQAEKIIRRLIDNGESWDEIEAGVARYARYCKSTGWRVQDPKNFFADIDRPWLTPWTIERNKAEKRLDANVDAAAQFLAEGA